MRPAFPLHGAVLAATLLLSAPSAQAQTKTAPRPAAPGVSATKTAVTVYKTPTCGCCGKWVEHMQSQGFACTVTNQADLSEVKTRHGVPANLQSCHTSLVGGYVIEGHVPAEDIKRLLREKPAIVGLAAPGMPPASPGMDVPGAPGFDVISFDKSGQQKVYASHPGR